MFSTRRYRHTGKHRPAHKTYRHTRKHRPAQNRQKKTFQITRARQVGNILLFPPLDRRERVLQLDDERGIMFGYRGVLGCPILRDVPGKPGKGKVM